MYVSPTFGQCSDDVKVLCFALKKRSFAEKDGGATGRQLVLRSVLRFGFAKGVDCRVKMCAVHAAKRALVKHATVAAFPIIVAASRTNCVSRSHVLFTQRTRA